MRSLVAVVLVALACSPASGSSSQPPTPVGDASAPPSPPVDASPGVQPNDPRTVGDPRVDGVLATLPPCGADPLFTAAPTSPDDLWVITPLGKWNPGGNHVFPVNHHYVLMLTPSFMDPNAGLQASFRAPAKMRIVTITGGKTTQLGGSFSRTDYAITAWVCDQLRISFAHVSHPSAEFLAAFGPLDQDCQSGDSGGMHSESCSSYPNKDIDAGTLIGTTQGYDFGAEDFRIAPHPFVRQVKGDSYIVSPFDYFDDNTKKAYAPFVGAAYGDGPNNHPAHFFPRTVPPIMGTVDLDVAGSAQGKWYQPKMPDMPDGVHAALVPDYLHPDTTEAFSLGRFVGTQNVGVYMFDKGSGSHNRAFSEVKAGGTVYCYDGFYDRHLDPDLGTLSSRILLTMPDATHLELEVQASSDCNAPAAFTGAAVTFER